MCRYGIRSLVYLKDKNGLVLQPTRSPSELGVTYSTGTGIHVGLGLGLVVFSHSTLEFNAVLPI